VQTGYFDAMSNSADALRRWFGLFFLALAFGFLIWGQTVLRDRLTGISFLAYWFCCFLFTMAAIITALLDVRATRKRAQQEHEELIQRTLDEIDRESHDKSDQ
jgi:membrane protein implicated in regulation of membrane protease activity